MENCKQTKRGGLNRCCRLKSNQICAYPNYEDPFDEGEAEARDGPVAARSRGGQTEGEEEADPVEEERHWEERTVA